MTYQTLDRLKFEHIETLRVVDLKENQVFMLDPKQLDKLKLEWRDNYFNPEWDILANDAFNKII